MGLENSKLNRRDVLRGLVATGAAGVVGNIEEALAQEPSLAIGDVYPTGDLASASEKAEVTAFGARYFEMLKANNPAIRAELDKYSISYGGVAGGPRGQVTGYGAHLVHTRESNYDG